AVDVLQTFDIKRSLGGDGRVLVYDEKEPQHRVLRFLNAAVQGRYDTGALKLERLVRVESLGIGCKGANEGERRNTHALGFGRNREFPVQRPDLAALAVHYRSFARVLPWRKRRRRRAVAIAH